MKSARFKTLCCVAFGSVALAACAPGATIRAALAKPTARKEAPAFDLADSLGRSRQLTDYRGKVVLLNFWATECGGCRLEIPWLADIDRTFKEKSVAVIGISTDVSYEDLKSAAEGWAKVKPFIEENKVGYAILMGDAKVSKAYEIQALPVTYLIDARGRIAATYVGLIDQQNVTANIEALLAEEQ